MRGVEIDGISMNSLFSYILKYLFINRYIYVLLIYEYLYFLALFANGNLKEIISQCTEIFIFK